MFERPLKLRHDESQRVFFTSDTHFGHAKSFVYESRGYKSVEDHDNTLINKINECVRCEDILFHLGDFCLNTTMPRFLEILQRVNCQNVYYVWGNHNSCIRKYYEDAIRNHLDVVKFNGDNNNVSVYPYRVSKIIFLGYYKEIIVNKQLIVLHHYPHDIFNQMKQGAWQLSGHSHYTNPKTQIENTDGKILDVGWDGHCKPLNFDEINKIMSNKKNDILRDRHH